MQTPKQDLMENGTHIPPDGSAGHETTDASIGAIAKFIIATFVGSAIIALIVYGIMRVAQSHYDVHDPPPSPMAVLHEPPPEPRLQPSINHPSLPYEDMNTLRAKWDKDLNSFSPVPGKPDETTIPIGVAMKILADKGIGPATRGAK